MNNVSWLLAIAIITSGCTHKPPHFAARSHGKHTASSFELAETPFFPQEKYQCGPAALATVLQSAGVNVTPQALVPAVYLPERRGSLQAEMVAAVRRSARIPYLIEPVPSALLGHVNDGRPVLVLQNLGTILIPVWHYAVVIGYMADDKRLILRSGRTKRLRVSLDKFMASWKGADSWGLAVIDPSLPPAGLDAKRYLKAVAELEEVGEIDTAMTAYKSAVAQWPDNPVAWFGLGNAHYLKHAFKKARRAYNRSLRLKPDFLAALNNLAMSYAETGQFDVALTLVDKALSKLQAGTDLGHGLKKTRRDIIDRQLEATRSAR